MFAKKYFLSSEFLSHPKVLHVKLFFLIRSIAYENLRLTANNREKSRQHTKNYDFLIRTLSHLKIRMWETSIRTAKLSFIAMAKVYYILPHRGCFPIVTKMADIALHIGARNSVLAFKSLLKQL